MIPLHKQALLLLGVAVWIWTAQPAKATAITIENPPELQSVTTQFPGIAGKAIAFRAALVLQLSCRPHARVLASGPS